jgi:hypothetical protein
MTNWAIDYLRLLLSPSDEYVVLQSSGSSKEFVLNDEPLSYVRLLDPRDRSLSLMINWPKSSPLNNPPFSACSFDSLVMHRLGWFNHTSAPLTKAFNLCRFSNILIAFLISVMLGWLSCRLVHDLNSLRAFWYGWAFIVAHMKVRSPSMRMLAGMLSMELTGTSFLSIISLNFFQE